MKTEGYCIELFKFMRIDEKYEKKKKLDENRKKLDENRDKLEADEELNHTFLAFGEFDKIGIKSIKKFSRFRDISAYARGWIGDRQVQLIYRIQGEEDEVWFEDGGFYEKNGMQAERSFRLFFGLTILQFKYSQKKICKDMGKFLKNCKRNIVNLVHNGTKGNVKCAVLGTLGSFGLSVIWLADQYTDILEQVTNIKNKNIAAADVAETENLEEKPIFLSAYTIFAKNEKAWNVSVGEEKINQIKGDAVVRLTLKKGVNDIIKQRLQSLQSLEGVLYHCAGEHDIMLRMKAVNACQLFHKGKIFHAEADFFKNNILQTNVQLCETLDVNDNIKNVQSGQKSFNEGEYDELEELDNIQTKYLLLRQKFEEVFPRSAGMVDTLDLLYSDYISKISTASNEMWVENLSYQILSVLESIFDFMDAYQSLNNGKGKILNYINNLLHDFEWQISHIAESNNLILGTPVCQFRYSGQNNLTLYAYYGIIKEILEVVYKRQEVSSQIEIVPLIVAEIVPIIKSRFCEINTKSDSKEKLKIITINIPMTALYDPVCYYPYLYHELFHYIVPKDRHVRNKILGCLISVEMAVSIFRELIEHELGGDIKWTELFVRKYMMQYIYSAIVEIYETKIGTMIEDLNGDLIRYSEVRMNELNSNKYELEVFNRWIAWINNEGITQLSENPMYLLLCYIEGRKKDVLADITSWVKEYEAGNDSSGAIEKREKLRKFFTEAIGGIVKNGAFEGMNTSYEKLMSVVDEMVVNDAIEMVEAVKEAMADIAMVEMQNMRIAEYLFLFTKTRKDLLIGKDEKQSIQDNVRIGMVVDFYCRNNEQYQEYMIVFNDEEECFVNMYCGFYLSAKKTKKNDDYLKKLVKEAEEWFQYFKGSYQEYLSKYSIYSKLFYILGKYMVITKEKEDGKTEEKKGCHYWKAYADVLRQFGCSARSYKEKNQMQRWEELCSKTNGHLFELNIEFIHAFQQQETFKKLKEVREKQLKKCADQLYQAHNEVIDAKLEENAQVSTLYTTREFYWEYNVNGVEELSKLLAEIAKKISASSKQALGKKEMPIWYRGQQSSEYKLIPSIMRKYKEEKNKVKEKDKFSLAVFLKQKFEEFRFRADGSEEAIERSAYTSSDYIALMQHYSVASNFLDWTEDALAALYFALEGFLDDKTEKTNGDAALYIFNPALYNYARTKMINLEWARDCRKIEVEEDVKKTVGQNGIPNLTVEYNRDKYYMYLLGKEDHDYDNSKAFENQKEMEKKRVYYLPIAAYVSRLNKRIQAQNGNFLVYNIYTSPDRNDGFDYISLEEVQKQYLKDFKKDADTCPFLYKIEIVGGKRREIAEWVRACGMSKERCYPELVNYGERVMR